MHNYRKMIRVKVAFVRFFGEKRKFLGRGSFPLLPVAALPGLAQAWCRQRPVALSPDAKAIATIILKQLIHRTSGP